MPDFKIGEKVVCINVTASKYTHLPKIGTLYSVVETDRNLNASPLEWFSVSVRADYNYAYNYQNYLERDFCRLSPLIKVLWSKEILNNAK